MRAIWNVSGRPIIRGIQTAFEAVESVVRTIIGAVQELIGAIQSIPNPADLIPNIPTPDLTPGFDIPGVPFFADGGFIRRPTLNVAGEAGDELLLPLTRPSRMRQLLNEPEARPALAAAAAAVSEGDPAGPAPAGGGGTSNYYFTAADNAEVFEEMRRRDRRRARGLD